jgi:NhaP-type Na+/H+ or K+/H+ antiporter
MSTGIILLILGCFYFAAHALAVIFQKTRIPDVLILVIAGILIGPGLGLASPEDFGRMGGVVTVIALAVILFESGTSLKLQTMASCATSTLALTLVTVAVTIGVVTLGTLALFGGDWSLALLTGTILCGTSSAVVIPMVKSLRLSEKPSIVLILESALTDVVSIILSFALLESMRSGLFSVGQISQGVVLSLVLAAVVGVLGGIAWLLVWKEVRKLPTTVFTTIAFAFILYGVAETLGVSGAIATLMFGVTLANFPILVKRANLPTISEPERAFYQEIVFLLKIFFFIFLGVSAKISDPKLVIVSVVLTLIIYFARIWITRFTLMKAGVTARDASAVAVLIPKGLAAAVLASLVAQQNVPHAEIIQGIVFSVVIFGIFLTAVLIPMVDGGLLKRPYDMMLSRWSE